MLKGNIGIIDAYGPRGRDMASSTAVLFYSHLKRMAGSKAVLCDGLYTHTNLPLGVGDTHLPLTLYQDSNSLIY